MTICIPSGSHLLILLGHNAAAAPSAVPLVVRRARPARRLILIIRNALP